MRSGRGKPGFLILEDGNFFEGTLLGDGETLGEVVFNTAMTGYQEAVTDPSYAGQIITFTYPMVGNYGVSAEAMESSSAHAVGVVMREAVDRADAADAEMGWLEWLEENGVPALTGVNTRVLVRHVREFGAMRGGIFPSEVEREKALEVVRSSLGMEGRDLASSVGPAEAIEIEGDGAHVVALDTGIKSSIVSQLSARGCRVTLLPPGSSPSEVVERNPDLVFLANGPGDPAAVEQVVGTVRDLVGKFPVVGICLGHQLLCRAVGLETFKLRYGHRGSNHPVKDLETGVIEITSQNHGFAVCGPDGSQTIDEDLPVSWETDFGPAVLSHVNLYDRTIEGLRLPEARAMTVQHHPEAGPGPHDARHLFDRFLELAA
ncbi:MAG: glutamine-hydrolyzing carbamoyl-phosphate synthase small subunit [Solirubrobacterales bacterium]